MDEELAIRSQILNKSSQQERGNIIATSQSANLIKKKTLFKWRAIFLLVTVHHCFNALLHISLYTALEVFY